MQYFDNDFQQAANSILLCTCLGQVMARALQRRAAALHDVHFSGI